MLPECIDVDDESTTRVPVGLPDGRRDAEVQTCDPPTGDEHSRATDAMHGLLGQTTKLAQPPIAMATSAPDFFVLTSRPCLAHGGHGPCIWQFEKHWRHQPGRAMYRVAIVAQEVTRHRAIIADSATAAHA